MTLQQKQFIDLVNSKFIECAQLGGHLEQSIQYFLIHKLEGLIQPTSEEMESIVSEYFVDASVYDTGICSDLFMNAFDRVYTTYRDDEL